MDTRDALPTFLIGIATGAIVGASVALLTAPQSGQETREQIAQKSHELRGKVEETYADVQARAETAMNDMQARMDDLSAKVDEMIAQAKQKLPGTEPSLSKEYVPQEQSTVDVSV